GKFQSIWVQYSGDWKDNQFNGRGVLNYLDGGKYEGSFVPWQRNGFGKQIYSDGAPVYEGSWKNDRREGHGVYVSANGDRYEGGWKGDKQNGYGLHTTTETEYAGGWIDGIPNGHGRRLWKRSG